jgi:1-aminocyclopropane-1-carboxylate deaminase/D-cysteine desulfhydrase-like pyridoxal-dependent ACC family enzyme
MASPPRFRLFDGPSPLHALPRLSAALGDRVELWAKREDLLPLAFGGNKLRNLEFLVGAALAEAAGTIITSGRRWSNHARLTAAAGALAGLRVHLVLSGPPVEPPGPGIQIARAFGATVHQLATAERAERDAAVEQVAAEVEAAGGRPYVIGVGGSGGVGVVGQVLAGHELIAQADAIGLGIDRVVLPTATGGTQAGLLVGLPESMAVSGIVAARTAAELRPAIAGMVDAVGGSLDPAAIDLDERFIGAGYGRRTAAAEEAAALLARTEAILVDPIYTAKALAGLVAGVRSGAWDGQRIVFWHAGGLPGLFEPLD